MQQISYNSVEDITDDIRKQIGWRIQEKRIEKGITAVDLSTYLNITANQVSRIERGCAGIDIYKLIVICKILGVSADYILFGEMKEENITIKYIHEYVKNKEYMIVGTERRHGFSQNDVDRQWHQIVDKIRKKQVDGVIVANMSVITDNLIDAFIKVAQVQAAGGIIVTVDDGRLAMQLRGF